MYDIRHRIGVAGSPAAVYQQVATTDGLKAWWTDDVRGDSEVGEKVSFHFNGDGRSAVDEDRAMVMEVVELRDAERVAWRCVEGPAEWVGTDITFDIKRGSDTETVLLFEHAGWREPVEFMYHCSTKWGSYLQSLLASVETGTGQPFPDDVRICSWD
jgi:uncharacterized protein YndB with AHSA1/START domain